MLRLSLIAFLAACTSGAPPGFSGGASGEQWVIPLVGPLEDGQLITAVTLNTHGPYLFAIDPDAPMSVIDASLAKQLDLRTFEGPKRLDESDTQRTRIYAEMTGLEIGTLIVERRDAVLVRTGTFDTVGRRVVGILGKDVFADSVAWGFDRDNGVIYMITQKAFKPPPDAQPFVYGELDARIENARVLPPARRLVDATVNGQKLSMHVDLGAVASQLREERWDKLALAPREIKAVTVDEVGEGRLVTKASEARVTLGSITNDRVAFIPYGDKRWLTQDIDGTLGLGFFQKYDVWQSWHTKTYWVVPRQDIPVRARINRWDSAVLSKCKNTGCASIRVTDPLAGKEIDPSKPQPGLVLSINREDVAGGMALEVVLEARGTPAPPAPAPAPAVLGSEGAGSAAEPAPVAPSVAPGSTSVSAATLPRLIVNMPGHVDKLLYQLPATYRGMQLEVIDASPFPRECPSPNGCVDQLAR